MNKYYAYEHLIPNSNIPFYVGKGSGDRATSLWDRNKKWHDVVNTHGFKVKLLAINIDSELAYFIEKERIDQLKQLNITLCNLTNGGGSGYKYTEDVKKRISKSLTGKKVSDLTKQKLRTYNLGKTVSLITRDKLSKANSKTVFCVETNEYFNSVKDAAKYYGVSRYSICAVCNGTKKTLKNLHWKYITKD
jgi:hypothetical protein